MRFKATLDGVAFGPADEFRRECANRATIDLSAFSAVTDLNARPTESGHPKPIAVVLSIQSTSPAARAVSISGTRFVTRL